MSLSQNRSLEVLSIFHILIIFLLLGIPKYEKKKKEEEKSQNFITV